MVQAPLAADRNLDKGDARSTTPLQYACLLVHEQIVRILLEAGAEVLASGVLLDGQPKTVPVLLDHGQLTQETEENTWTRCSLLLMSGSAESRAPSGVFDVSRKTLRSYRGAPTSSEQMCSEGANSLVLYSPDPHQDRLVSKQNSNIMYHCFADESGSISTCKVVQYIISRTLSSWLSRAGSRDMCLQF